jgi:hypothetical protein
MFTTATRLASAFSNKNQNIVVQERLLTNNALAVVARVSIEKGLEGYLVKEKSINSQSFIQFLDDLRDSNDGYNFVLFLDNCSVHHSKIVT